MRNWFLSNGFADYWKAEVSLPEGFMFMASGFRGTAGHISLNWARNPVPSSLGL